MIFGQFQPYSRKTHAFTRADHWGARVAQDDLLRAWLRHCAGQAHLFVDPPPLGEGTREDMQLSLRDLQQEFGEDRVAIKSLLDVPAIVEQNQYVFPTSQNWGQHVSYVRQHCRQVFPICYLVHSVLGPHYAAHYPSAILTALPCDAIVTTSEAAYQAVRQLLDNTCEFINRRLNSTALQSPQLTKVPFGVDSDVFYPRDRRLCREIFGWPQDATILLWFGRISGTYKADLEALLVAFKRLLATHPKLCLVISGHDDGAGYGRLIQTTSIELGLSHAIKYVPNVINSMKPLIYSAADIFVSPVDNVQESFGLSILEAMSSGLPVIASDWNGYRDLVVHEETGFLVPTLWNSAAAESISPVSPIIYQTFPEYYLAQRTAIDVGRLQEYLHLLISATDLRARLAEQGRRRAIEVFEWRVVIRQFESLWRDQCDRANRRRDRVTPTWSLSYSAFQHYATELLTGDIVVRCSDCYGNMSGGELTLSTRLPVQMSQDEVSRVFQLCHEGARSIKELQQTGDSGTIDAVAWLLKKGILEICRDGSSPQQ